MNEPARRSPVPLLFLCALVSGGSGCRGKTAADGGPADAGAVAAHEISDPELGVLLPLHPDWRIAAKATLPAREGVRTLAEARRVPWDTPFLLQPRLIVTAETIPPSSEGPSTLEAAGRHTLRTLQAVAGRPGVRLKRTSLRFRQVGNVRAADVEVVYETRLDSKDRGLVQRSLVALSAGAAGSETIVTVSSSYLEADRDRVEPEIDVMLDDYRLDERAEPAASDGRSRRAQ